MTDRRSRSFPPLAEPDLPSVLADHDGALEDDDELAGVRLDGSWTNVTLEGIEISGRACLVPG